MNDVSKKTPEEAEFERWLAGRTAKLLDYARPYVGGLASSDREAFLEAALRAAWETRKELDPEKPEEAGLLLWWDKCLRSAALTRPTWRVTTFDYRVRLVPGRVLGVH